MPGSLDGIRVLDLTTIYSGPIAASILGDQGADVVKVESPDGDFMRRPGATERNGVGGAFAMMNRNKRSVVIDLTSDEGRAVFERLVEGTDVVVENYRPGVMERLKIGYERLRDINPRLIFASINGVGHTGPYAGRRVYDAIIQSISGIGSLQADPASERPILINSLICDKITSMTAAQAITSALLARERTGIGQRVDIAMLDAALFFLWPDNMLNYTFVGDEKPAPGRQVPCGHGAGDARRAHLHHARSGPGVGGSVCRLGASQPVPGRTLPQPGRLGLRTVPANVERGLRELRHRRPRRALRGARGAIRPDQPPRRGH